MSRLAQAQYGLTPNVLVRAEAHRAQAAAVYVFSSLNRQRA
jgi:hypothetical protein